MKPLYWFLFLCNSIAKMVMGNANSRRNEEVGPSGVGNFGANEDQDMGYEEGEAISCPYDYMATNPMPQFPRHRHRASQAPLISSPEDSTVHLLNPGDTIQVQFQSSLLGLADNERKSTGPTTSVKISWNHGGSMVSVIGSWDNWKTRLPLQNSGNEFVVMKALPSGIFYYCFIVDGRLTCAPDLPWINDDSGNSYNVLDLLARDSELPENLCDFEPSPSPPRSYDNELLNEDDFREPPPELPPQLQPKLLSEPSLSSSSSSPIRPHHTELNHLYQNNVGGQFMALGTTFRTRQKYISMMVLRPSQRPNRPNQFT